MRMKTSTQHLTLSALLMATGIVFPLLFHFVGLGPMFLPMFWPIAVAGFLLPVPLAAAVGAMTPIVSALSTGMPPPPILYKMIFELAVLAGTVGLLYRKTRCGTFLIVLTGVAASRATGWLASLALAPILGLPRTLYAAVSILEGTPGIIALLVLIPFILKKIFHESIFKRKPTRVEGA